MSKSFECTICKGEFEGWGANPQPLVLNGMCCDNCDKTKVIPARIEMLDYKMRIKRAREDCKRRMMALYEKHGTDTVACMKDFDETIKPRLLYIQVVSEFIKQRWVGDYSFSFESI